MIVNENHIKTATKIAEYSNVIKARMSCLALSKRGKIICCANNRLLTGNRIDWSEHTETAIIRKLNRLKAFDRYKDITIFVFRISSSGISMARPCSRCQKLLNRYPVKVLYTNEKGKIVEL